MAAGQRRPETVANLEGAIVVVEGLLAAIGDYPEFGTADWHERRDAYRQAQHEALKTLVGIHGADHGDGGGFERLRFAGVQTTCTSGPSGLMRNWIRAARRRLEGGAR